MSLLQDRLETQNWVTNFLASYTSYDSAYVVKEFGCPHPFISAGELDSLGGFLIAFKTHDWNILG